MGGLVQSGLGEHTISIYHFTCSKLSFLLVVLKLQQPFMLLTFKSNVTKFELEATEAGVDFRSSSRLLPTDHQDPLLIFVT